MCVIQFNAAMSMVKSKLFENGYTNIEIPQERPRCKGETLGCTSAVLECNETKNTVIFLADGRFHMEGAMIANPSIIFYKYNPYEKLLSLEKYAFNKMIQRRQNEIEKNNIQDEDLHIGIIFGILGRQGSPLILQRIKNVLMEKQIK